MENSESWYSHAAYTFRDPHQGIPAARFEWMGYTPMKLVVKRDPRCEESPTVRNYPFTATLYFVPDSE
jgi:hypothetical protein